MDENEKEVEILEKKENEETKVEVETVETEQQSVEGHSKRGKRFSDSKAESKKKSKSNSEDDETVKSKKSGAGKKVAVTIILLILFLAIAGGCYAYVKFSPKFNDVTIELGTETVTIDQFLKENTDASKASFITDIATIDYTKAGSHEIELKYEDVTQKAMLNIVDTVAPVVEFQNVDKYVDYELNADDFIKSKTDLAEMTASIVNPPEIDGIGTYDITVEVRDASNNVTSNVCTLNISRVKKEVTLELGDELTKKDILLNYKEDKDALKQSDIDKINKKGVGEYELVSEIDGATETIKIIIKDTKAPELKLKEVTIYEGEDGLSKGDFISSVKDASDDVTTKLVTKIDYSKIGSQEIVITAEDKYGNKTEKKTTLTIKKDTDGPVFYGLSSMSVEKNSSVNYKSGVRAVDARDGSCTFTVDTSKVKLSKAGTYYIKYTAKDKKGNTTTANRKIVVNHNQEDTNNKFNSFYNSNLAGKSVASIVSTIRNKIGYDSSWGGSDPVWYGLTNYSGNCYVHAVLVQKALNKKGITNKLIYTTDRTHYWNLVYQNGKWRHYDATPGGHLLGPATDKEKAASSSMQGRKWSSSFPKAEWYRKEIIAKWMHY